MRKNNDHRRQEVQQIVKNACDQLNRQAIGAQTELRRLLSFHIVSQIGYLAFGIGLFTIAGVGGALFYLVHYTIVKCALFLVSGATERVGGGRDLKKRGFNFVGSTIVYAFLQAAGVVNDHTMGCFRRAAIARMK